MTGERWPNKRARAVLFAGANKRERGDAGTAIDPNVIADTGLMVRELLFVDDDVREETADVKAHRIGYSTDCMQFATLEPVADGLALDLWVGTGQVQEAAEAIGAQEPANAFRKLYGWVRVPVAPASDMDLLSTWIRRARRHAVETKATQNVRM